MFAAPSFRIVPFNMVGESFWTKRTFSASFIFLTGSSSEEAELAVYERGREKGS